MRTFLVKSQNWDFTATMTLIQNTQNKFQMSMNKEKGFLKNL